MIPPKSPKPPHFWTDHEVHSADARPGMYESWRELLTTLVLWATLGGSCVFAILWFFLRFV